MDDEIWTLHQIGAQAARPASPGCVALLHVAPEGPQGRGPRAEHAAYVVGGSLAQASEDVLVAVAAKAKASQGAASEKSVEHRAKKQDRVVARRALRRRMARSTSPRPGG